jgi:signal transduction histidine kinase
MAERRAQEEKRTLLDIVTHEIRNPLATIRLASQGLNVSLKDHSTSKSRLGNIKRAIDAIDEVIARCDLYNRLESNGIQPEAEIIDLAAMVNELVEQYGLRPRATIDGNGDTPVTSDSQLLSILLGNLFDNARKYARHDSPIWITVDTAAQGGWEVVVRNSVEPGHAPDPERIFERYYRKDTDSPLGGSGLGLPLARHIARALGGELTYRAHQDEVCFSLNIQGD